MEYVQVMFISKDFAFELIHYIWIYVMHLFRFTAVLQYRILHVYTNETYNVRSFFINISCDIHVFYFIASFMNCTHHVYLVK